MIVSFYGSVGPILHTEYEHENLCERLEKSREHMGALVEMGMGEISQDTVDAINFITLQIVWIFIKQILKDTLKQLVDR